MIDFESLRSNDRIYITLSKFFFFSVWNSLLETHPIKQIKNVSLSFKCDHTKYILKMLYKPKQLNHFKWNIKFTCLMWFIIIIIIIIIIGFPRVFQTFFIHFHSENNSISSRKMSLNKSRFQFQTCFKQFQNCVIMFQTVFIDFRRFVCLIRPILRRVVNRGSKFVLCHSYSNFFH